MEIHDIYSLAITHWGKEKQLKKAIEELTELRDEVESYVFYEFEGGKELNVSGFDNIKQCLITEMADVYNMLNQIGLICNISQKEIDDEMKRKMERTYIRIQKDKSQEKIERFERNE
jgi:hypothetical protein